MAVTSLTDLASGVATASGIKKSSSRLANAVAALSSGKRITQAMQDIASLAAGTALQTQVTSLRQASLNVSQASSMLQVADGAMGQIGDILQRMQQLSVQANSGALSGSAREGLNREYQQLGEEINRLAGNTNFNNVNLLDGSLSGRDGLVTNTNQATNATGALQFNANVAAGKTIVMNGVTLTAGVDFGVGATIDQTLDNLVSTLNNSTNTALSGATFSRTGQTLNIRFDSAGTIGNQFTINEGASTANGVFDTVGTSVNGSQIFSLQGGSSSGIGGNQTTATGVIGDNLLTSLNNTPATTTIQFSNASNIVAGNSINIDDGNGGLVNFTFVNGTPASNTQIQIGSTLEETLQNAASTINNFSGSADFVVRQLDVRVNGNSLEISGQGNGNVNDAVGAAANITLSTAGGFITNTTLNNGSTGGVDVSGVSNAAFNGSIQGFSAQQTGTNSVRASVTVGGVTYSADIANTNSGANQTVRFTSQNGGFFDVQLAGGNGQNVNSQSDADNFANRLDAAFAGLNFSQTREVSNFNGSGLLNGASLRVTGDDFAPRGIESVRVVGAVGGSNNAVFEVTINGETFRSNNLGRSIGAGETIELTSLNNADRSIAFTNGVNRIDLSSQTSADQFRVAFEDATGTIPGGGGAAFQVGDGSDDVARLNIGDMRVGGLFPGGLGDILTQGNASFSSAAVNDAINRLVSARADVGAFQGALNYTAANIESAMQNQDAARAQLLDTDFASTSTELAQASLLNQASIALQAQTNRLAPNILDLLRGTR